MSANDLVLSDVHLDLPSACTQAHHSTTFTFECTPFRHHSGGFNGWHARPQTYIPTCNPIVPNDHALPSPPCKPTPTSSHDHALVDKDGDLLLERRSKSCCTGAVQPDQLTRHQLCLLHHGATPLDDVGLQIWRGECLLVDYLLHQAATGGMEGVHTLLELGSGVGMASVAAAKIFALAQDTHAQIYAGPPGTVAGEPHLSNPAPDCASQQAPIRIFCTDCHVPSLVLAERNFYGNLGCMADRQRNSLVVTSPASHAHGGSSSISSSYDSRCSSRPTHSPQSGFAQCAVMPQPLEATAAQPTAQRVSSPHSPTVEVAIRRIDWMDFTGTQDPQLSVPALLQQDEAGGSTPLPEGRGHLPDKQQNSMAYGTFGWQQQDLEALADLDFIIAGDVVYDETLTAAMLSTAAALLQYATDARARRKRQEMDEDKGTACLTHAPKPQPRFFLALEKRWCFTLRDMDSRAPAFDHFCSLLNVCNPRQDGLGPLDTAAASLEQPAGKLATIPYQGLTEERHKLLHGRRLDVDSVPQRLQGYERGPDLELWELSLQPFAADLSLT